MPGVPSPCCQHRALSPRLPALFCSIMQAPGSAGLQLAASHPAASRRCVGTSSWAGGGHRRGRVAFLSSPAVRRHRLPNHLSADPAFQLAVPVAPSTGTRGVQGCVSTSAPLGHLCQTPSTQQSSSRSLCAPHSAGARAQLMLVRPQDYCFPDSSRHCYLWMCFKTLSGHLFHEMLKAVPSCMLRRLLHQLSRGGCRGGAVRGCCVSQAAGLGATRRDVPAGTLRRQLWTSPPAHSPRCDHLAPARLSPWGPQSGTNHGTGAERPFPDCLCLKNEAFG